MQGGGKAKNVFFTAKMDAKFFLMKSMIFAFITFVKNSP